MTAPVAYFPDFLTPAMAQGAFLTLRDDLAWERRETAPRSEYWTNTFDRPYTYGSGMGQRTYEARPDHALIKMMRDKIAEETDVFLEGCFLNHYHDGQDSLGMHADDDDKIDHTRPILVITLGSGRPITFKSNEKGAHPQTLFLDPGSLLVMQAGMQQGWRHAIPKADAKKGEVFGPRISATFRGLKA